MCTKVMSCRIRPLEKENQKKTNETLFHLPGFDFLFIINWLTATTKNWFTQKVGGPVPGPKTQPGEGPARLLCSALITDLVFSAGLWGTERLRPPRGPQTLHFAGLPDDRLCTK